MRRGRPPFPDILTPRQREVLELVRQGLSNTEIARRLGISRDGVKFHVSEIITRLGVRKRREAARWRREEQRAAPSASLAGWRAGLRSAFGRRSRKDRCRRRAAPQVVAGAPRSPQARRGRESAV